MPKTRSVSDVKSNLLRPALTSVFEVEIGLPSSSLGTKLRSLLGAGKQDQLNLMCSEAVLPGSQLATTELNNHFTGVTERHAYRRIYDETIDLSFYVDATNYLPIQFFEEWISGIVNEDQEEAKSPYYNYRVMYPDDYMATGLKVIKFEKDYDDQTNDIKGTNFARSYKIRNGTGRALTYEFVKSWPKSITSMPVTYDASSLLKCSVQMTYVRYVHSMGAGKPSNTNWNPFTMSQFNFGGLGNFGSGAGKIIAGQIMSKPAVQDALRGANDLLGTLSNFG